MSCTSAIDVRGASKVLSRCVVRAACDVIAADSVPRDAHFRIFVDQFVSDLKQPSRIAQLDESGQLHQQCSAVWSCIETHSALCQLGGTLKIVALKSGVGTHSERVRRL